jgi:hypothetical protein
MKQVMKSSLLHSLQWPEISHHFEITTEINRRIP